MRKEKQFLIIDNPNGDNQWKLNINTGEFLGLRGKPIKNVPPRVEKELRHNIVGSTYVVFKDKTNQEELSECLRLVDSFYSMGFELYLGDSDCYRQNVDDIQKILKHPLWKKVLKRLKEDKEYGITVKTLKEKMYDIQIAEPLMAEGYVSQETTDFIFYVCQDLEIFPFLKKSDFHGIERLIRLGYRELNGLYFRELVRNYLTLSFKLEKPRQYSSFVDDLAKWTQEWELRKDEFLDKEYQDHVLPPKDFEYQDETFQIVTSKHVEDIKDEAERLSHCLYRCYTQKIVKGEFFVVYVRSVQRPNIPLYTLQLRETIDGIRSGQFYGYGDSMPSEKAYSFVAQYLKQLNEKGVKLSR